MAEDYEPGTGPFDWERPRDYWSRKTASDSIVRAGELYAIIDNVNAKIDALHQRTLTIEERLVDTRIKHLAGDVLTSVWSRFLVIVLAVLTAFLLTNFLHTGWPPW